MTTTLTRAADRRTNTEDVKSSRKKSPAPGRRRSTVTAALAAGALLSLAACGGNGAGGGGGDAGGEPQLINDGEMVVAMSGEFQPFSYFENNELTGFDYDIAVAIAEEMGLKLETKTGAFDTLIQGVKSNRYDVLIASMTPTEERDRGVDFTDSYYTSGATMFVRNDSDCEDPTAMDGPSVGVASGTTYESFLKEEDWVGKIRTFPSDVTALQDVDAGRLDGAMTDRLVGLFQINEADRDLRVCGEPLYTEEPAFAVKEGNAALVEQLNEALAAIKDDGTYAEISEKWYGQDIS